MRTFTSLCALCLLLCTTSPLSALAAPAIQVGLNNLTITKVEQNMLQIANKSWEIGTAAQALLELRAPSLAVFRQTAFPPANPLRSDIAAAARPVLDIATQIVRSKVASVNATPLIEDGASGDPASIGPAVLLANWTRSDPNDWSYGTAAYQQALFLTTSVPRTSDNAISHRTDQVQLWADFVYMAPPFLAYYGALVGGSEGEGWMSEAIEQCRLYRQYLKDGNGLWKHVVLGNWQDNGHWATGNAWAAAGMLRTALTIRNNELGFKFTNGTNSLISWTAEILNATWKYQQSNGTLLNVIDDPTSFADSAATALLAATTYRYAALTNDTKLIPNANRALDLVRESINSDGWLLNTVDPLVFSTPSKTGEYSPEGQAFVLLLHAGWKAYLQVLNPLISDSDFCSTSNCGASASAASFRISRLGTGESS